MQELLVHKVAIEKYKSFVYGDLIEGYCSWPFGITGDIEEKNYFNDTLNNKVSLLGSFIYFLSLYNLSIVVLNKNVFIKFINIDKVVKAIIDKKMFQSDKTKMYYTDGKNYYLKILVDENEFIIDKMYNAINEAMSWLNKLWNKK